MFSDSCRNFHQLSKFAIKNLVKGRKVKFMAFYWPFWPLKVKFWNIMQLTRSCQAFSFGFVSLNDLILKIIFGSPITRRDYVVHDKKKVLNQFSDKQSFRNKSRLRIDIYSFMMKWCNTYLYDVKISCRPSKFDTTGGPIYDVKN